MDNPIITFVYIAIIVISIIAKMRGKSDKKKPFTQYDSEEVEEKDDDDEEEPTYTREETTTEAAPQPQPQPQATHRPVRSPNGRIVHRYSQPTVPKAEAHTPLRKPTPTAGQAARAEYDNVTSGMMRFNTTDVPTARPNDTKPMTLDAAKMRKALIYAAIIERKEF